MTSLAPYRKSHPLAFSLTDADFQPVLYIAGDGEEHELVFDVRNSSPHDIALEGDLGAEPSSGNHHFALRFRPGTLSAPTLEQLTSAEVGKLLATAGWKLGRLKPPALNETVTLYLLCTQGKVMAPNEQRSLTLRGFSAAPGHGSRGTQVEVVPHQVAYQGDPTPITFVRTQYVHITNHRGLKTVPLRAAIVSGGTLLSDGKTPNTVGLRLTNILPERDLAFTESDNDEATKFSIAFDVGPEDDALVRTIGAARIGLVRVNGQPMVAYSNGMFSVQGKRAVASILFYRNATLESGQTIDFEIHDIVTTGGGTARVSFGYDNVPGYRDGQLVCSLKKSLLVPGEQGMGIGTRTPIGRLNIAGSEGEARSVQIDNGEIKLRGDGDGAGHFSIVNARDGALRVDASSDPAMGASDRTLLSIQNSGKVSIARLEVRDPEQERRLELEEAAITFRTSRASQFWLGTLYDGNLKLGSHHYDLQKRREVNGTPLSVQASTGHVGIGTDAATAQLTVEGTAQFNGPIRGAKHAPEELALRYPALAAARGAQLDGLLEGGAGEAPAIVGGFGGRLAQPADFVIRRSDGPAPRMELDPHGKLSHATRETLPQIVDLGTGEVKTFIINHPADDARYLVHATLEGPEGAVYYRGTARLSAGRARVELPAYFEALTHAEGRTVMLTNVDGFDLLAVRTQDGAQIQHGTFVVAASDAASTQAFNWEVKAVRRDVKRLDVEPLKSELQVQSFGPYTYGTSTRSAP